MSFPVRGKHMCNFLQEKSFLPGHPGATFLPLGHWRWWHLDHDGAKTPDSHLSDSPQFPKPGQPPSNWSFPMEHFSVAYLPPQVPPALAKVKKPRGTPHQHGAASSHRWHTLSQAVSHWSGPEGGLLSKDGSKSELIGKHPANIWALVKHSWGFLTPSAADWEMLS